MIQILRLCPGPSPLRSAPVWIALLAFVALGVSGAFTFTVTRSSAGLRTVVTSPWLTPEVIAELK